MNLKETVNTTTDVAWLVDDCEDVEQSDGISIISESECEDSSSSSNKYYWDSSLLKLSRESVRIKCVEATPVTTADSSPNTSNKEEPKKYKWKIMTMSTVFLFIVLGYQMYFKFTDQANTIQELLRDNENLRNEINSLRKIIFLMDHKEDFYLNQKGEMFSRDDYQSSEQTRIFEDKKDKYICVNIQSFVNLL